MKNVSKFRKTRVRARHLKHDLRSEQGKLALYLFGSTKPRYRYENLDAVNRALDKIEKGK